MTPQQFKQNRLSIISKKTGKPLKQIELATMLYCTQVWISNIETGKKTPSPKFINAFELLILSKK